MVTGVSSGVAVGSLLAVGASLIAVTSTVTVAVSHSGVGVVWSQTRYVNVSVPLKSGAGS